MLFHNYLIASTKWTGITRRKICLVFIASLLQILDQAKGELTFYVSENATKGTEVASLTNSSESFFLLSPEDSPFRDFFDVTLLEASGIIVTTDKLDHEVNPTYFASLLNAVTNNHIQVEVVVIDINDNTPTFTTDTIPLNITEATAIGSKYHLGSATDADSQPFNVQGYRIISGNINDAFFVKNRTVNEQVFADLVVNRTLNREVTPSYSLTVEAYDGDAPPKSGTVIVRILILDANDNPPIFNLTRYSVELPEDYTVGEDVITITASDKDSGQNSNITYRIDRSQSDPDSVFMVDALTGRIYLNKELDYEVNMQHKIVLQAIDGGAEPQIGSTVIIVNVQDINDNKPTIEVIFLDSDGAKVSEAAEIGDYIARVSVSDPDLGELPHFNVTLQGGDGKFDVQTENDVVYLVCADNSLDRETQSTYHITLIATDFGSPPQTASKSLTLTITDVNDNPPEFEDDRNEVELPEDSFPGTFVMQLEAKDADEGLNAEVTYRLQVGPQSSWFDVNENSGVITTDGELDYDQATEVRLILIATDKGNPPKSSNTTLVVSIVDSSASAPQFEQSAYSTTVAEDALNGTCFLQVQANNPDWSSGDAEALSYSLVIGSFDSPISRLFSVAEVSGWICVKSKLDREKNESFDLQIQATDKNGQYDRTNVHVTISDVNDNSPVFHPVTYEVNVDRGQADVGFPVTQVTATDRDDPYGAGYGRVTYSFIEGNDDGLFGLHALSGLITVAKPLHEVAVGSLHQLTVGAVDGGNAGAALNATVDISVVDGGSTGGPTFKSSLYKFVITEGSSSAFVGNVSAQSPDGGLVTYSIRKDPPHTSWFAIDPTTGLINVTDSVDREILSSTSFQVVASSGSPPVYGFTTVQVAILDTNDNAPRFEEFSPLIAPYNIAVGSTVKWVKAVDRDNGLNGTIRYNLTSEFFGVDSVSGRVFVKLGLPQATLAYTLFIDAYDLGVPQKSSMAPLVVEARAPDPSCPVFMSSQYNLNINEDRKPFVIIDTLKAFTTNNSARVAYSLGDSPDSHPFAIYPNGSLYLRKKLDFEVQQTHTFVVRAKGFPLPPMHTSPFCMTSTSLTVTVHDVNDNAPIFVQSEYTFHAAENRTRDSWIGNVHANDLDSGHRGRVDYSIQIPNTQFYINAESGDIYIASALNHEVAPRYTFGVEASDGQYIALATVHVIVDDVNDNAPEFVIPGERLAVVTQQATGGDWVADLRTTDADGPANNRLSYSFVSGPTSLFDIDNSGTVTVKSGLSQANVGIKTLQVKAEDNGSPKRSSVATLKVKVRSASSTDNPHQFDASTFVFQPLEGTTPGALLGSFASDVINGRKRRSVSSNVTYRISGGNQDGAFYVNETTGDVTLQTELNFESKAQYILQVERSAPDGSGSAILSGHINVRDKNDHSPKFDSGRFVLSVSENAPLGFLVRRFSAVDSDSGANGRVTYSLVSQSPLGEKPAFEIDSLTGELTVASRLDRETTQEYVVVVNASDGGLPPRFSTSSAIVLVRDVNDNSPMFTSRDQAYVMEDEPAGFPVMCLVAWDPDLGPNGRVRYGLVSVAPGAGGTGMSPRSGEELFHVDSNTGIVSLAGKLDFEKSTYFLLNVSATDISASQQRTTYQTIEIHVIDVNDVTPQFLLSTYEAEVTEEQNGGVVVTRVTAVDGDSGENGRLTYHLQANTESDAFTIDPETGVITTTRPLDREKADSHRLTVYVQDGAFPALYDWCEVVVTVLDINDNPPILLPLDGATDPPLIVSLEVPEFSEGPMLIHHVVASDLDAGDNGKLEYFIVEGDPLNDFFINSTSGELWTTRRLDRETTAFYSLKLVATDLGSPIVRQTVGIVDVTVLDWNDNDPQFVEEAYVAEVTEEQTKGQYVTTVRATDKDLGLNAALIYSLDTNGNRNLSGLFTIDSATGVITTLAPLDAERARRHTFRAVAVDSAPYGPRQSSVTVTVNVLDINDNFPIFDPSLVLVNVTRASTTGMQVTSVQALDADTGVNGDVTYSFATGSNPDDVFSIAPSSGVITTTFSFPASYPHKQALIVVASDQGEVPKQAQAVVEVTLVGAAGGKSLQFQHHNYFITMPEVVQDDHLVRQVTALLNGAPSSDITYGLQAGNEVGAFRITNDGRILVAQPKLLDYETEPNIRLIAFATVEGLSAYAIISINLVDDNDNAPVFTQDRKRTSVWEEKKPGLYVTDVAAYDPDSGDNGDVEYVMETPGVPFKINAESGVISTTLKLDREAKESYTFTILAHDKGAQRQTGSCRVTVTVVDDNDLPPVLTVPRDQLELSEGAAVGTHLTTVTANDRDSNSVIKFSFAPESNPGGLFAIDKNSGEIYLIKALDYEDRTHVSLRVIGNDSIHVGKGWVNVTVLDENDNKPEFVQQSYQAHIRELSPRGTNVTRVLAHDRDSNEYGRVSYRLGTVVPETQMFVVDSKTGLITINSSEPFNPQSSGFHVEIQAYDHGVPSLNQSVSVRIQVDDVNDNGPMFSQEVYKTTVSESAVLGLSVTNVTATDSDFTPENNNVHYKIVAGNVGGAFKVRTIGGPGGQSIGEVFVARQLDRENVSLYTLTVEASDKGVPPQSSNSTVIVHILEVNDNSPYFTESHYYGEVMENDGAASTRSPRNVLKLLANDADSNSDFKFKIISGDDLGAFELRECDPPAGSCTMLVAKFVDYEVQSHYELTVQVSDARNSIIARTATAGVSVDVLDVNEFKPKFTRQFYMIKVEESTKANIPLIRVTATDRDGGMFGDVIYSVLGGSPETLGPSCVPSYEMFSIDQKSGEISARRELDYEECHVYRLYIEAADASGLARSQVEVSIGVLPLDEYPPHFETEYVEGNPRYVFSVPYGSPAGYVVGQVNATDADAGPDGVVRFRLDESSSGYFVVNESTGVIKMARAVDSGNARILLLTAESSQLSSVTHIKVEITGTPPIAVEAQILSIVFGIIAFVACLIVAALCLKHCRNKKARASAESAKEEDKTKTSSNRRMLPDGSPDQTPFHENHHQAAQHGNAAKSGGDFPKNRKYASSNMSGGNGVILPNGKKSKQHTNKLSPDHQLNLSGSANSIDLKRILRHRIMRSHDTGNDGSAEDEEVHRITMTSSSSGRQSSSTSLISDKKTRVADSGIQQDMDRLSLDARCVTHTSSSQQDSVESIHEFGSEEPPANTGAPSAHHDVIAYPQHVIEMTQGGGEEMAPAPELQIHPASVHLQAAALGALDDGQVGQVPVEQLQDWTPEFQPLSSVFSEIARLREESAAIRQAAAKNQQQHALTLAAATAASNGQQPSNAASRASNSSSVVSVNPGRPPPLLTAVPQHSGTIAAPVPIATRGGPDSHIDLGHVPLKGLYPRPNPQYPGVHPLRNHPAGVPPPYSYVMSARPNAKSSSSTKGSKSGSSGVSTPPYGSVGIPTSVESLPRTPNSHESSFTSPAMSPSLSPSLSPLAEQFDYPISTSSNVHRSRSDDTNIASEQPERMVHV